ncbi:MAG TPA: tail fiber domain-containing protein [bacterium]|nr:tail fiber domain-containing protein [bacterium]
MASLKQFIANAKSMLQVVTGQPGWLDPPSMHLEQVTNQIRAMLGSADQFAVPDIDLHQTDASLKAVLGEADSTAQPAISLHDTATALKAITGKASATEAPDITLTATKTHVDATNNPHATTAAQVGAMATSHPANAITGFGSSAQALGSLQSPGVATTVARSDHVHPYPTAAQVGAIANSAGSVTDTLIGNRTADPSLVPTGNTGTLTSFLSWFANRVKAVTGTTNWYDAPPTTLAATNTHINATNNPHATTAAQVGAMATSHPANAITGFGSSAQALGSSQSPGTATTVSRSDHRHPYPTPAQIGAANANGDVNNLFYAAEVHVPNQGGLTCTFSSDAGRVEVAASSCKLQQSGAVYVTDRSATVYKPINASAFTVNSARDVKTDVTPLESGLEKVRAIRPVRFRYSQGDDPKVHAGCIAEEVEAVFPEAVFPMGGVDGIPASKGIDYGRLAVLSLQAVKELDARLQALEARPWPSR